MRCVERLLAKRPPQLIAGAFFSGCMFMILVDRLTGGAPLITHLLEAFAVSVLTFGLRRLEEIFPGPK